jgi:hypothetical protein
MKRLPEKMVMAAIILSCGFVSHSDPSAQDQKAKRTTVGGQHKWQVAPAQATARHATVAKAIIVRGDGP